MQGYFCRDEREEALRFARELEVWAFLIRDKYDRSRLRLDWDDDPHPRPPRRFAGGSWLTRPPHM